MAKVVVVDDEELMRELVSTSLQRMGHNVQEYKSADEFLKEPLHLRELPDLLVTDMKMPGTSGLELAEQVLKVSGTLPIILMTAYGTVENAVQAIRMGVQDFIEKPFQVDRLEHMVRKVFELSQLKQENVQLKQALEERFKLIGNSDTMTSVLQMIQDVAASRSTVLVTGESGTGKELMGHALHSNSNRSQGPFIKVNCAAIPENLIESELFGHEKGAYTGAVRTRIGKFEEANGGTILLDEIGEMPIMAQSKLLRVLQERELTKVGSNISVSLDVRVVCTTHRDLAEEVEKGNFREDLFYRLNVIPIHIPPLRERKEDIPLLCEHFIHKYNTENGFSVTGISEQALECLMTHSWPGNIRELENVLQRAVVFAKSQEIEEEHLKLYGHVKTNVVTHSEELYPGMTVHEGERTLILKTLKKCNENRTKAAEMLDISVRTLRNKLKEYQLSE